MLEEFWDSHFGVILELLQSSRIELSPPQQHPAMNDDRKWSDGHGQRTEERVERHTDRGAAVPFRGGLLRGARSLFRKQEIVKKIIRICLAKQIRY